MPARSVLTSWPSRPTPLSTDAGLAGGSETDGRTRLVLAGTVASERQLTGIINSDDSFKVGKSVDRLSSLDPKRYRRLPVGRPTSRTGLLGTASRSARILKVV